MLPLRGSNWPRPAQITYDATRAAAIAEELSPHRSTLARDIIGNHTT
ncbi:hypothetical protein [Streptomyces vinaceus]